jgi:hypothetical protein
VPLRLTAAQWIDRHRLGKAAIVEGQRLVAAVKATTGELALVAAEVADPDPRCAVIDGRLDAEDMARVLTGFRGQPIDVTPDMRYVRRSADGNASAYVFDADTGMVYILD